MSATNGRQEQPGDFTADYVRRANEQKAKIEEMLKEFNIALGKAAEIGIFITFDIKTVKDVGKFTPRQVLMYRMFLSLGGDMPFELDE